MTAAIDIARAESKLIDDMVDFVDDPLGFVMYAYPWDTDPSIQVVKLSEPWSSKYGLEYGPDDWACEFLEELGRKIRENGFDGLNPVDPIREAVASGHGIGKSAITAWLVTFIMSTRPFAQGTVTANTSSQLETKTWAQVAKWTKRCVTSHWFTVNTGRGSMKMYHNDHPEDWFCTAQTCREENSEAFAGQHAANSTSFYINDEASAVPGSIWEVQEGGLTDGEPMQFAFGNPTRNSGKFYDCFHKMRHRWNTRQIDSRDVKITNKKHLQELIDDYGIDSDIVKVRVRGLFPSMSVRQFISVKDADAGYGRSIHPSKYEFAPKILTLDNAWEGDDEVVIGLRQGLAYQTLRTMAKNDNDIQIANILAHLEDEHEADAVFIDGGYGTGVLSAGKVMHRYHWRLVWFASTEQIDEGCLNMRAYMYKCIRDWLKDGGCYPADPQMHDDLIGPETVPRLDGKIQLESKKDMKKRGLPSPGRADALALSFAYPVAKKNPLDRKNYSQGESWDPHEAL
jgi:hypothetical protein